MGNSFTSLHNRYIYAALTLLPENWGWLLETWQHEKAWAQVVQRPSNSNKPSGIFEGSEAATPELAFLSAVLKSLLREEAFSSLSKLAEDIR